MNRRWISRWQGSRGGKLSRVIARNRVRNYSSYRRYCTPVTGCAATWKRANSYFEKSIGRQGVRLMPIFRPCFAMPPTRDGIRKVLYRTPASISLLAISFR